LGCERSAEWITYGSPYRINETPTERTDRTLISVRVRFVRLWAWTNRTFVRFVRFVRSGLEELGRERERREGSRCGGVKTASRLGQAKAPTQKAIAIPPLADRARVGRGKLHLDRAMGS